MAGARPDTPVRAAAARLAAAGVPSPQHDARVLVAHADAHRLDLDGLLAARAGRVPLQHLIGTAGFRYLDLAVGPGVFVPRPETELLVDAALAALADIASPLVVDLCAGSGAIGLSIAHEHPTAMVHLVERQSAAFDWLQRNAHGHNRVTLHLADLADAPSGIDGTVDVVVSNPPYVPLVERELVEPEVRDHDPAEALWAGTDGLDVIERVIDRASGLLRPGGTLIIEHSERQADAVPALLREAGFGQVVDHRDLTDRPRYATAVHP
jgi:release factor glutamine methyltransferase